MYKKISAKEGIEFFPSIGSVFISSKKDLWANPFQNRELRARCFFNIDNENMEIFFHLTSKEFEEKMALKKIPNSTYFFGAYNQINVCQMRAFGKLYLLTEALDIQKFKEHLIADLNVRTNDTKVVSMDQVSTSQKQEAIKIISEQEGMFFKFIPQTYAYHVYERG